MARFLARCSVFVFQEFIFQKFTKIYKNLGPRYGCCQRSCAGLGEPSLISWSTEGPTQTMRILLIFSHLFSALSLVCLSPLPPSFFPLFIDPCRNGYYHYGSCCNCKHSSTGGTYIANSSLAQSFHVYAVEWFPDNITWYVL